MFFSSYGETVKLQQSIFNQVMQSSTSNCVSSCEQDQDINIVAVNSNIGTLDISQRCQVLGNSCVIKTIFDSTIDNLQQSLVKQAESIESDLTTLSFGTNASETVDLNQAIRNTQSQINNVNCKSDSTQTKYVNITLINTTADDILISQDSAVDSNSCTINNSLKSYIKNNQIAKVDQSIKSYGMLAIIAAIIIMVVIGIIVVVVVHGGVKVYSAKKSVEKSTGNDNNNNSELKLLELMELENLENQKKENSRRNEEYESERREKILESRDREREDERKILESRDREREDERRMLEHKRNRENNRSNRTLVNLSTLADNLAGWVNDYNGNRRTRTPIRSPLAETRV